MRTSKKPIELVLLGVFFGLLAGGGSVCASNQKRMIVYEWSTKTWDNTYNIWWVAKKTSPCILSMKLIWALLTSPYTVQCSFWQHLSLSCQCNMLSKHASFLKQPDLSLVFDVHFAGRVSLLVGTHGKKQQPPTSPWKIPIRQEADHQNDLVSRDPVLYPLRCPRPIGCQSNFAIQPSWNSHELPPSRVVIYPKKLRRNVDEWMAYLNIIYFSGKEVSLNTVSFTKWASGTGFCWMVFMNYKEER